MKSYPILKIEILVIVTFCLLAFRVSNIDYNSNIPQEYIPSVEKNGELSDIIEGVDFNRLKESFPYQRYLDTVSLYHYASLHQDLILLDSLNPDNREENREVLINTLTTELSHKITPSFQHYNIDSLIILYQWANRFNYYKDINNEDAIVYAIAYEHWMNFISNKLGEYYQSLSGVKYDYKFKYLLSACRSKLFLPPTGNAKDEKIIKYISEQKYAYLFNRFWNGTELWMKLSFLMIVTITMYSIYFTFKSKF